jgi:hypothetical protein
VSFIAHRTVNPPIEYKQIIISQLSHSEILKCKGQKRVVNLVNFFFPNKQICGLFGNCKRQLK